MLRKRGLIKIHNNLTVYMLNIFRDITPEKFTLDIAIGHGFKYSDFLPNSTNIRILSKGSKFKDDEKHMMIFFYGAEKDFTAFTQYINLGLRKALPDGFFKVEENFSFLNTSPKIRINTEQGYVYFNTENIQATINGFLLGEQFAKFIIEKYKRLTNQIFSFDENDDEYDPEDFASESHDKYSYKPIRTTPAKGSFFYCVNL